MFRLMMSVLATLIVATAMAAKAQTYYAYRESGSRVDLTVQDSVISVKLAEGKTTWHGLFLSVEGLDSSVAPEEINEGFSLLRVKSEYNPETVVEGLRVHPDVLFANLSFIDEGANPIYLTETFVANFHSNVSQAVIDSMNSAHGVEILGDYFNDPTWLLLKLTEDSDVDVLTMGNLYHESAPVRYAKAGMMLNLHPDAGPTDPYWIYQWQFKNDGWLGGVVDVDIDLNVVWLYHAPPPSSFVTVAILDDGFAAHDDFPAGRFSGGWDYFDKDADYSPAWNKYHGMGVMGIIGATSNNDTGIVGITNQVRIIGQKVESQTGAFTTDPWLAKAFSDAVLAGARVICCSWSCRQCATTFDTTTWWIRKADSVGVSVVFSSGNGARTSPSIEWPSNMPEVITVGACDSTDGWWDYSSYGPELDVVAPSGNMANARSGQLFPGDSSNGHFWTLDQMGTLGRNDGTMDCREENANYNCGFGGTSAAAPQVAGIIALILLRRPDLVGNTELMRQIISKSADRQQYGIPQFPPSRYNDKFGWGRANAGNAMLVACRGDADNSGVIDISDAVYINAYIFAHGPVPKPFMGTGDADCSGGTPDISDAVFLIAYIFGGGPAPGICYVDTP